jgi:hypothetical protein
MKSYQARGRDAILTAAGMSTWRQGNSSVDTKVDQQYRSNSLSNPKGLQHMLTLALDQNLIEDLDAMRG